MMNDSYLWDRTGEADPDVRKLEELLSELRYQPQPLRIPAGIKIERKPSFFPMAIAAAISFFAIALSLWFYFARSSSVPPIEAVHVPGIVQPAIPPQGNPSSVATLERKSTTQKRPGRAIVARAMRREVRDNIESRALTAEELAQKEQLLLALRLVSAKLSLVQRKTQSLPQPILIRNQHKIG